MAINFLTPPTQSIDVLGAGLARLQIAQSESFRTTWQLNSTQIDVARGLPIYRLTDENLAWSTLEVAGWSYLLLSEGRLFAFADLEPDENGVLNLCRLRRGPSLRGFIEALEEVQQVDAQEGGTFSLGILEILPLGRLFWLKGESDFFIPIRPTFLHIRLEKIMNTAKLERALRAFRKLFASIDDEPRDLPQ